MARISSRVRGCDHPLLQPQATGGKPGKGGSGLTNRYIVKAIDASQTMAAHSDHPHQEPLRSRALIDTRH